MKSRHGEIPLNAECEVGTMQVRGSILLSLLTLIVSVNISPLALAFSFVDSMMSSSSGGSITGLGNILQMSEL